MIANIMNHFPPFENINTAFHFLLFLSLSMLVPACVVMHWSMDNNNCTMSVGFKDANESRDKRDYDYNVDSAEVSFSESHFKDAEHSHDHSFLFDKEEADGTHRC